MRLMLVGSFRGVDEAIEPFASGLDVRIDGGSFFVVVIHVAGVYWAGMRQTGRGVAVAGMLAFITAPPPKQSHRIP